jgi:hypothetical protein
MTVKAHSCRLPADRWPPAARRWPADNRPYGNNGVQVIVVSSVSGKVIVMFLRQIFDRLAIGGVLVASAIAWQAIPVLICGILVGGSAIPLAFRAYREKTKGPDDLEGILDRRLSELEARIADQLSEMEYRTAQLMESVEERIDFAEQLMVNQRGRGSDEPPMGLPIVTPIKLNSMRRR